MRNTCSVANSFQDVGRLTLGSGVSYTSPQYGWTCDSAVQFQIVLADGSVVIADAITRPDLFRALKGGGNNFGSASENLVPHPN
jgi:FAD/FMN-containing dehydrogenase